jgi:hypothetical protein
MLVGIQMHPVDGAAGGDGVGVKERTPCVLANLPNRICEAARSDIPAGKIQADGPARVVELRRRDEKDCRHRHPFLIGTPTRRRGLPCTKPVSLLPVRIIRP